MRFICRIIKFGPSLVFSGISLMTLAKWIALFVCEPELDGASSERPSIFVYSMY